MINLSAQTESKSLAKELRRDRVSAGKAVGVTVRDLKKRGPTQVAKAVTKRYAIKMSEVKPGSDAASVRGGGSTVAGFSLTYKGRVLTPLHFKMSPPSRPDGRRYKIKATILRGHRVVIGAWGPKGSEGGRYARPASSPYFLTGPGGPPFRREGDKLKAMRTLSVPQMVGNDEVAADAMAQLRELADKRLEHNIKHFMK